eukprot:SAG22_NODE_174_length_16466_cov_34.991568_6_plen_60_part_00
MLSPQAASGMDPELKEMLGLESALPKRQKAALDEISGDAISKMKVRLLGKSHEAAIELE